MPGAYIKLQDINHINAELSNYCNAACPMCARFDYDQNLIKGITNNSHTTLDDMKNKIGPEVLKNVNLFRSCGNVGDGTMNPECAEIYEYVKQVNDGVTLSINTNGGARNPDFYRHLAQIGVKVIFSIDGLEDTNHLYRRNVKWSKVMDNAEAFVRAGGHAEWDYLIFEHNQKQVSEAESLSRKIGFRKFNKKTTTRWDDFDSAGNWIKRDKISVDGYDLQKPIQGVIDNYAVDSFQKTKQKIKNKIACNSFTSTNVEIFLHANGNVSPCCWLGDLQTHESKNIIKDYKTVNIHHRSLEEILEGHYFNEIWKGIQGFEQQYKLVTCENVCGVCYE